MTETATPENEDLSSLSDEEITAPSGDDAAVQEIARSHPSAGSDSDPEGVKQEDNIEGAERAADSGEGGAGAGEDYAGSGF